ncbi:tyrosine--tRNA ligase [Roseococcus sp. SYP-B2431]|uniref:tyrosine--tRNA ligase n=1 Tax=Roseococcus sp. SYP-B2431 TaxID=2496640 RepID=UPI00103F3773|nr:tyrosine--tRNA ligase [Roseococcus sp. SYP-B2431]TCH99896.1 tyrosine--tRNA ligase [Roseococcus sp. SYP-B2431]
MSDFLEIIRERGFIHQVTDEAALTAAFRAGPVAGYIGFDATADSLHVGHLVQIMMLRWMARTGNRPVALMGGGTTKIGDPSGRDETRMILTEERIEENKAGIRRAFANLLEFGEGPGKAMMLDNAEWLDGLRYIPFLREVGRHFSVNRMLTMDSVRLRLERDQPLTFIEFNYMLLQSYDFVELRRRHGVTLQMGGSDQWGNIVLGADLVRRMDQKDAFGITAPLITTASGAKMGKTAAGAVWLNADRVSPYDYWQFWRNAEDADVGRFLALFTELPMDEVRRLGALQGAEVNEAKKILATAATALLHGRAAADSAAETARQAFEQGAAAETLPSITSALPASLADLLVSAGLASSKGEARRLVAQNGIRLNDDVVSDAQRAVTAEDLQDGAAKLSAGRKKHVLVRAG